MPSLTTDTGANTGANTGTNTGTGALARRLLLLVMVGALPLLAYVMIGAEATRLQRSDEQREHIARLGAIEIHDLAAEDAERAGPGAGAGARASDYAGHGGVHRRGVGRAFQLRGVGAVEIRDVSRLTGDDAGTGGYEQQGARLAMTECGHGQKSRLKLSQ